MSRILSDNEINDFLKEKKLLPESWKSQLQLKPKSSYQHEEGSFVVKGESGNDFKVIMRRNKINTFDFSIILIFRDSDGREYKLVRCNGKHASEHTNKWEKEQGYPEYKLSPGFHIHLATQRYQEAGYPIDDFAEITNAYHDFNSALNYFLREYNFKNIDNSQTDLFGEEI